jgi:hypothetical protein
MKKAVGPRTINYELQLLRGVMTYADCWTSDLEARYQPLRQPKSRVGKAASEGSSRLPQKHASWANMIGLSSYLAF